MKGVGWVDKETMKKVTKPIETAPPEIRRIIEKVLQLESTKLNQSRPQIKDDVIAIVKREVN